MPIGAREREAVFARLALLGFATDRCEIATDGNSTPTRPNADAVCVITTDAETALPGYVRVWRRRFAQRMPLWEGVREKLGPFGALAKCLGPGSPMAIVGGRTCTLPIRGTHELYFVRQELADAQHSAGPGPTDRMLDIALSFFHVGKTPIVGATLASLITAVLGAAAFFWFGETIARACMGLLFLVATLICIAGERWARRFYLSEDPREVVLDEVAGMSVALLAVTGPWWFAGCVVAFVLFRVFDVFKTGVHWVEEKHWPGTIVWDDVLAGLYAGILTAVGLAVARLVV